VDQDFNLNFCIYSPSKPNFKSLYIMTYCLAIPYTFFPVHLVNQGFAFQETFLKSQSFQHVTLRWAQVWIVLYSDFWWLCSFIDNN